jgi:plasmid stabilization system protein ParE
MSYRVRYSKAARDDLRRLYAFLLERDLKAARRALDAIGKGIEFLR